MIVYFARKIEVDLHCCQESVYCCEVESYKQQETAEFRSRPFSAYNRSSYAC